MKLNLKKFVAKTNAKNIIEAYENLGYEVKVDENEWVDSSPYILFHFNKGGRMLTFDIPKEEFEEKKPLKPYVWYPVEKFDGNPNNYILLERDDTGLCYLYNFEGNRLSEYRSHFMYIERLKEL